MRVLVCRGAAKALILAIVVSITATPLATYAQTPIKIHGNKFALADDVKLGQEAAAAADVEQR